MAYCAEVKEQSLTLRLPGSVLQWIESVRGGTERSEFIIRLLEQRMEQNRREHEERERWLAQGRRQYIKEVCAQTLQINEEFPVHEG